MIDVQDLTIRYGRTPAVDHLTFTVTPGRITGFLGPNGAGKSTTMRAILGLHTPTAGRALIDGRPYTALRHPLHTMGALLDATAVHGGRTARAHLTWLARSNHIPPHRVTQVLDEAGLHQAADRRIATYSLGMRQRLGIAAALLGDPQVLMLDEPLNGLDVDGIRWIRTLLRRLAGQGRTVLLSSHLMNELALTADHVIVIAHGRLIADTPVDTLAARFHRDVLVRATQPDRLAAILRAHGATVTPGPDDLSVRGLTAQAIGEHALAAGIALHELTPRTATLEEAFLELTDDQPQETRR
ncbi:ABC transporter ATP-binding protein [Nonomuraea sp. NPDC049309]|uniref:ABC transporter ATP-binding protein n=1 Tax=Nonomuraea sp. NPDC049309 TaxID=3364350 RepID=UPI00371267DD